MASVVVLATAVRLTFVCAGASSCLSSCIVDVGLLLSCSCSGEKRLLIAVWFVFVPTFALLLAALRLLSFLFDGCF